MHDNSIIPARINVRYWHLADIAAAARLMSAFGGKADIATWCRMSAFDPFETCAVQNCCSAN